MAMTFQNKDVTAHCGKVATSGKIFVQKATAFGTGFFLRWPG